MRRNRFQDKVAFVTGAARGQGRSHAVALAAELVWALSYVLGRGQALSATAAGSVSSVREIGRVLFTDYAFPFEATSILILVAMVGAVVLARRERASE